MKRLASTVPKNKKVRTVAALQSRAPPDGALRAVSSEPVEASDKLGTGVSKNQSHCLRLSAQTCTLAAVTMGDGISSKKLKDRIRQIRFKVHVKLTRATRASTNSAASMTLTLQN